MMTITWGRTRDGTKRHAFAGIIATDGERRRMATTRCGIAGIYSSSKGATVPKCKHCIACIRAEIAALQKAIEQEEPCTD